MIQKNKLIGRAYKKQYIFSKNSTQIAVKFRLDKNAFKG
jgi:hypothetical protein